MGSSLQFLSAMILMGIKEPGRTLDVGTILDIIFKSSCYCGFMGSITYFIRYLMTMTFMFQISAEESRDAIITIFDNIPDSVLLVNQTKTTAMHPDTLKQAKILGCDPSLIKISDGGGFCLELNYFNQ